MAPSRVAAAAFVALALMATPSLAAPPADAFCVILIEGLDDFRSVRVLVDEETTVEERAQLFPEVDRDGDGVVTRDEADVWRFMGTTTYPRFEGLEEVRFVRASGTVDGEERGFPPLYAATWRQVGHTFHKQDHEQPWPVTEPVDLETQEAREFRFPADDATRVVLSGGLPRSTSTSQSPSTTSQSPSPTTGPSSTSNTVTIEYVVVRAPPGWRVANVEGYTYEGWFSRSFDGEQSEVDLPAFDTKSAYQLTFERLASSGTSSTTGRAPTTVPSGGEDEFTIPSVGLGALLALLCLAVAIRRRL
jgi:hypothetical protein